MLGEAEGEGEPKVGYGKEKTRHRIPQYIRSKLQLNPSHRLDAQLSIAR